MSFLLLYWRWVLLAMLVASNALTFKLWRGAVEDLTVFKAQIQALGAAAEADKKRIEAANAKTLKEIKDAIPKQIAAARSNAVRNYLASLPTRPGGGEVPGTSGVPGGADGSGKEPVAAGWTCAATPAFIEDAAQDAATLGLVQEWVRKNGLPVK